MKNLIVIALLTLSAASFCSCGKTYKCDCPPGQSLSVSTTDEDQARNMCEQKSGGACTL